MRTIDEHKVNPVNDAIDIKVMDEPGAGGACHSYRCEFGDPIRLVDIVFQNGPINEHGVNGLTHEALLAIVIDRLRSFQAGPFNCKANACAITHLEEALHWLQSRTLERMRRGVEGTHQL